MAACRVASKVGAFVTAKRWAVILPVILTIGLVPGAVASATSRPHQAAQQWSSYLFGPTHTSYDAGDLSVTAGDVSRLEPIWQRYTDPTNGGSAADYASPVVNDGVAYVGLGNGDMYAISLATNKILWWHYIGLIRPTTCPGTTGVISTATVARDPVSNEETVYVGGPDGYLYALSAATGALEWRSVIALPSKTENNYFVWSSPTVANGKIYIGISSECDKPLVPAGVVSFDQHTGARIAYWGSLPAGDSGGSVWSSVAVLPNGDVVATTGNSLSDEPQIPHAESLVVLDGTTLKLVASFMVPKAQQVWDSDFGGSPTVFSADLDGVATKMVGACNKDGIYYAFRAYHVDAGPVWEQQIGAPSGKKGEGPGECDAAAVFNGTDLIEGGGTPVTLDGVTYQGSVQALDPATGAVLWATGLQGSVTGSLAEDGAGVIAAPVWWSPTGETGVYLLSAKTGAVLRFISTGGSGVFAQPVFNGGELLVGNTTSSLSLENYAVTQPAQSSAVSVSPSRLPQGSTLTIKVSGLKGAKSPLRAVVSGTAVRVLSVHLLSPSTAEVQVTVPSDAAVGARYGLSLTETNLTYYGCSACLTVVKGASGQRS